MTQLLSSKIYAKPDYPIKILQFGTGNFLRAFIEPFVQQLNKQANFEGSVVIAQSTASNTTQKLNHQDGLYTLLTQGIVNGIPFTSCEIIDVIAKTISIENQYDDYLQIAHYDELEVIISNTTESGIYFSPEEHFSASLPKSFSARLTHFLYTRYHYVQGNREKGFYILPCELIENNGDQLKQHIFQHATQWNLESDFLNWITEANHFYNTLVDRIVPGFPKKEYNSLQAEWGYEDFLAVKCEPYFLWVIEGGAEIYSKLPFQELSLNIQLVSSLQPYRLQKVRILNGVHTIMAITGRLAQLATVKETIEDAQFNPYLKQIVAEEIIPATTSVENNLFAYSKEIFDRFKNPYIDHFLQSILLNSLSKFKVRVLPIIEDYYTLHTSYPKGLTLALAALLDYYSNQSNHELNDDIILIQLIQQYALQPTTFVEQILKEKAIWGKSIYTPELAQIIEQTLIALKEKGIRGILQEVMIH